MIKVKLNTNRYDLNNQLVLKAGTVFNVIKTLNRYDSECYQVIDGKYKDYLLNIGECDQII